MTCRTIAQHTYNFISHFVTREARSANVLTYTHTHTHFNLFARTMTNAIECNYKTRDYMDSKENSQITNIKQFI